MSTDVRVVLLSTPDRATGERLATTLVEERHAACANVLSAMTSVYWWQGALERADEVLVVLKTPAEAVEGLVARAAALHPYDVPEVLALEVAAGHAPYLDWVRSVAGGGAA